MNVNQEYLTVNEVSLKFEMTSRNVRKIIQKLTDKVHESLLYKDKNHQWRINNTILHYFKPQKVRKDRYFALTIDPAKQISSSDIDKMIQFVVDTVEDESVEVNYVVEQKKSSNQNHIHCFVKCKNQSSLLECLRLAFGEELSYCKKVIYDLNGWKSYITKECNNIMKIKKIKND